MLLRNAVIPYAGRRRGFAPQPESDSFARAACRGYQIRKEREGPADHLTSVGGETWIRDLMGRVSMIHLSGEYGRTCT